VQENIFYDFLHSLIIAVYGAKYSFDYLTLQQKGNYHR